MGAGGEYQIEIAPLARRQMKKLPREVQRSVVSCIEELAPAPRPPGVVKLVDERDLYRIRAGNYRVIYQIRDRELVILIVKVGHRREIYS